jgi:hypothetical protein
MSSFILYKGWQILEIVSFFTHINLEKLSSVVQMTSKSKKIKEASLFPQRPNFSPGWPESYA